MYISQFGKLWNATQSIMWHCFKLESISRLWSLNSVNYISMGCPCGTFLSGTMLFYITVCSRLDSSKGFLFWFRDSFHLCFMISDLVSSFSVSSFFKTVLLWFLPKRIHKTVITEKTLCADLMSGQITRSPDAVCGALFPPSWTQKHFPKDLLSLYFN